MKILREKSLTDGNILYPMLNDGFKGMNEQTRYLFIKLIDKNSCFSKK